MVSLHQSKSVEKVFVDTHYQLDRVVQDSQPSSVLIKTINPQFSETKIWLENEYAILNQLDSSNIIKPYSLQKYKSRFALVFKDFKEQNLIKFLEGKNLTLEAFFTIAIKLVEIIE